MITYFALVPAAAVSRLPFDGKLYAHSDLHLCHLPSGKVSVHSKPSDVRLLRVDEDRANINGEAWIRIGKAGDAIAATVNLPFAVSIVQDVDF